MVMNILVFNFMESVMVMEWIIVNMVNWKWRSVMCLIIELVMEWEKNLLILCIVLIKELRNS